MKRSKMLEIEKNVKLKKEEIKEEVSPRRSVRLINQVYSLECRYCPQKFQYFVNCDQHEISHKLFGHELRKDNKAGVAAKSKSNDDPKLYECDKCEKKFVKKFNLDKHKVIHIEMNPLKCNICQEILQYVDDVKDHKKIHPWIDEVNKYFPFECNKNELIFKSIRGVDEENEEWDNEKESEKCESMICDDSVESKDEDEADSVDDDQQVKISNENNDYQGEIFIDCNENVLQVYSPSEFDNGYKEMHTNAEESKNFGNDSHLTIEQFQHNENTSNQLPNQDFESNDIESPIADDFASNYNQNRQLIENSRSPRKFRSREPKYRCEICNLYFSNFKLYGFHELNVHIYGGPRQNSNSKKTQPKKQLKNDQTKKNNKKSENDFLIQCPLCKKIHNDYTEYDFSPCRFGFCVEEAKAKKAKLERFQRWNKRK